MNNNYAFKVVCLDENNPIEYLVLDEVNKGTMEEVCAYLKENYNRFNMDNCKWIIIPISKQPYNY